MKTIFNLFRCLTMTAVAVISDMSALTVNATEWDPFKGFTQSLQEKFGQKETTQQGDDAADFPETANATFVSVDDPAYEWSQYEEKDGSAMVSKNGWLELVSKTENHSSATVTELEVTPEADLTVTLMLMAKAEEGKYAGMVFDYSSNRNYKAFLVSKKSFQYVTIDEGEISVVKQGLAKPGKIISKITFVKQGDKISVSVNDLDTTILKNVNLSNMNFGAIVTGKCKALIQGIIYSVAEAEDNEQLTTPE